MPYNRINAFGVEHGQVSPAEQFQAQQADAMRRAQMAALMSGAGGGKPAQGADQGFEPFPSMVDKPQELHAWSPDVVLSQQRQLNGTKDLMGLEGQQAMDLQKQKGADYLNAVKEQMAPANAGAALEGQKWSDMAGRRGIEDEGLRNRNFLEGAKATILRGMLPPSAGGDGAGGAAPTDQQGSERLLQILNGNNPDKSAVEVDTLKAQLGLLQKQMETQGGLTAGAGIQQGYQQAAPMLQGDLARMKQFIRSNNWSIAGNGDQLRNLYNGILQKAANMGMQPQAYRIFQEELKNTMRDALQENGMFFESAGSDAVRGEYGL
jgi:hypothetical protein